MYATISKCAKQICRRKLFKNIRNQRCFVFSAHESVVIPNTTLPEFIFEATNKYPNEIAVQCSFTGKKYTFDEIRAKSINFDRNLRKKLKFNKGDVIAIMLPNVPDYPICVLGAIRSGIIVALVNPGYTPDEISYQLNDCGAKAIITLGETYSTAKAAAQISKRSIPILTVKLEQSEGVPVGAIDLSEFLETKSELEDVLDHNVQDTILLPYSSGTTGLPKGVELTHRNIVANICQASSMTSNHLITRTENHVNVTPAVLPWFHIFGITVTLFKQIYNHTKIISLPKFRPESFIKVLSEHKPNVLYLVPPLISFMTSHTSIKPKFLENVATVVSGAAPLGKSDEDKLINVLGKNSQILQGYGLTETSPVVTLLPPSVFKKLGPMGSSGMLVPNTSVKIVSAVNSSIELSKANEEGEIWVKGPQVMKSYYNRPKETEETVLDGWFKSGDLGHFDENGLMYVTDRLKELIKVKGFQVAPAELEAMLRTHKDVSDAGVIPVPDNVSGQVPLAYVVPKPNTKLDIKDVHKYMAEKVSSYKQLKGGIIIVDSLPKSASGKLLRRQLRLQYQNSQK